jgi:pseudouridylate synthase
LIESNKQLLTVSILKDNKRLDKFEFSAELYEALTHSQPVVALETAVVTHGLPYPINIEVAEEMESQVRNEGVVPATICLIDGKIKIGLNSNEILLLANNKSNKKIGSRDLSVAISKKWIGGTTVSASIYVAEKIGIKVFATGGIGGVHRHNPFDISTDLFQLSCTPIIVVCSGAKNILNLQATLEFLETLSILIIGYQTDEFPAFLSRKSGLRTQESVENINEVVEIARIHWEIGQRSAIILAVPPPVDIALDKEEMDRVISDAIALAERRKIAGQNVTPFILSEISKSSKGMSIDTNIGLLKNNAQLAAKVAKALHV